MGRMCTGCVPVSVAGTYTDVDGNNNTAVQTVACGESQAVWSAQDLMCHGHGTFGDCQASGRVVCSRDTNGNLAAAIHQDECESPYSSCGPFDATGPTATTATANASTPSTHGGAQCIDPCTVSAECAFA